MADPSGSVAGTRRLAAGPGRGQASPRRRGLALVETAIVMPIFLLMILGMFEMSRMGMAAQLLTDAAREGCRVATIPGKTQADVDARVKSILDAGGIPSASCKPQMSRDIATSHLGDSITVSLSIPFSEVSWLATPLFLGSKSITSSATLGSERP